MTHYWDANREEWVDLDPPELTEEHRREAFSKRNVEAFLALDQQLKRDFMEHFAGIEVPFR